MPAVVGGRVSARGGEFTECGSESKFRWFAAGQFIVAAADVLHESVSGLECMQWPSLTPRGLLPGLVDGATSGLDPVLAQRFQVAGLTHLLAVTGAIAR